MNEIIEYIFIPLGQKMGRGLPPAAKLEMTERQRRLLEEEMCKRTTLRQYHERIPILLCSNDGKSISLVAKELKISLNTVRTWRRRWEAAYERLLEFEKGADGKSVKDHELLQQMLKLLNDRPRSGAPKTITLSQEQQIIALSCGKPTDHGVEMTTWTMEMLAQVAIAKGIIETISPRYVGKILKKEQVTTA